MISKRPVSQIHKIRKFWQFEAIRRRGVFVKGRYLDIWAYRDPDLNPGKESLFAVRVGKKTDTRATKRNLWKRRIREGFKKHRNHIPPHYAVVLQSKRTTPVPGLEDLEKDIAGLIRNAVGNRQKEE